MSEICYLSTVLVFSILLKSVFCISILVFFSQSQAWWDILSFFRVSLWILFYFVTYCFPGGCVVDVNVNSLCGKYLLFEGPYFGSGVFYGQWRGSETEWVPRSKRHQTRIWTFACCSLCSLYKPAAPPAELCTTNILYLFWIRCSLSYKQVCWYGQIFYLTQSSASSSRSNSPGGAWRRLLLFPENAPVWILRLWIWTKFHV